MASASVMHEAGLKVDSLGQCRGMKWGGRWEGCKVLGDTCTPMADSYQYVAKPPQ